MADGLWKAATFNINSVRVRLQQLLAWLEREQPDCGGAAREPRLRMPTFLRTPLPLRAITWPLRGKRAAPGWHSSPGTSRRR
jgi:hypothetical protein